MMRRIPGVARGREGQIKSRAANGEFMRGQLGRENRARRPQLRDHRRIGAFLVIQQNARMAGCGMPRDIYDVLEPHRQAIQRRTRAAAGNASPGLHGLFACLIPKRADNGIDLATHILGPCMKGIEVFHGGEAASRNAGRGFGQRKLMQGLHARDPLAGIGAA